VIVQKAQNTGAVMQQPLKIVVLFVIVNKQYGVQNKMINHQ
jgi:hypothetical protein